jgi:hypothetical protein
VYNDLRSLDRFGNKGFRCAAFVLSRVISRPGAGMITLDAGLTTIQVDGGRPHAQVLGLPARVDAPSQEHLKVTIESGPVPAMVNQCCFYRGISTPHWPSSIGSTSLARDRSGNPQRCCGHSEGFRNRTGSLL